MTYLLDDFQDPERSRFGTLWLGFSDQVMGGGSELVWSHLPARDEDPACLQLQGQLQPAPQTGAFVQVALPLVHSRYLFDARHFSGVHLRCCSPEPQGYFIHLRTKELSMPWQHYRAAFVPQPEWSDCQVPFAEFEAVSTTRPLNLERLTRIGVVAALSAAESQAELAETGFLTRVGAERKALPSHKLKLAEIGFYRAHRKTPSLQGGDIPVKGTM